MSPVFWRSKINEAIRSLRCGSLLRGDFRGLDHLGPFRGFALDHSIEGGGARGPVPVPFAAALLRQHFEQLLDLNLLSQRYAAQLTWANGRILEMVDRLLDVPAGQEPVIILQGDEGPFPERYRTIGDGFQWFTARPEEVAQKFGILNALHDFLD